MMYSVSFYYSVGRCEFFECIDVQLESTPSPNLFDLTLSFKDGSVAKHHVTFVGTNFRITTFQTNLIRSGTGEAPIVVQIEISRS